MTSLLTSNIEKDFQWLTPEAKIFLQRDYLQKGVSPEERIHQIADTAEKYLKNRIPNYKKKFLSYFYSNCYSASTPIWMNFGLDRGFPISCFGTHVEDSIESIADLNYEVIMMSKLGGGTSSYWGDVRHRGAPISAGGESSGSFSFQSMTEEAIKKISQGTARRGQHAAYQEINHPDIEEWFEIQTESSAYQLMSYGVCVDRAFIYDMTIGKNKRKRDIWAKVIDSRTQTGLPYIFFKDNANEGTAEIYKALGKRITHSNLCTEIMLPDDADNSFVCDLASMNLATYDYWKNTDAVEIMIYTLDAVMTEFIIKSYENYSMRKARNFAIEHRAIGLGAFGWHDYLQSKDIAFESYEAMQHNNEIFRLIQNKSYEASQKLVFKYDFAEPPVLKGVGRRNTTTNALAPTKSTSFIQGASLSIEPNKSNYYVKDLAKIKTTVKNKNLVKLLEGMGWNTQETWDNILAHNGSVKGLDFLSDHQKNVYKTFEELSQLNIIQQAAQRQQYIDQGQSLNLFIHPDTSGADISTLILTAQELGLKSLYYQESKNAAQELNRNLLSCTSCEA